ncbi:hypothetical protein B0A49_08736 [Cryomyces minteri]|uniref:Uncharacterized protein n=1 Tax=Cryomyces minteri TaxID=331657 RepID=A0A4U0WPL7_9PEZI|nr:hypothetical protein B0A49_08736 [Cryomyces minteri]
MNDVMARLVRVSVAHLASTDIYSPEATAIFQHDYDHCGHGRSRRLLALSNISPATTTPRTHTFIVDAARQGSEIDIVHVDHEPGSSEAVVVLGPFENAQMVLSAIRIRIRVDTHGEFANVRAEVLGEKDNKEDGVEGDPARVAMAIFYPQSTTMAMEVTEAAAKKERENAEARAQRSGTENTSPSPLPTTGYTSLGENDWDNRFISREEDDWGNGECDGSYSPFEEEEEEEEEMEWTTQSAYGTGRSAVYCGTRSKFDD